MRLLVLEFTTASSLELDPPESWLREGRAMLKGLLEDLASFDEVLPSVVLPEREAALAPSRAVRIDPRPDAETAFRRVLETSDAALVIAPETGGLLARYARLADAAGVRWLGCPERWIHAFSDKMLAARLLEPWSIETRSPGGFSESGSPRVLKPRDGAGSLFTARLPATDVAAGAALLRGMGFEGELVEQPFHEGAPASIALIARKNADPIFLPACAQSMDVERCPTRDRIDLLHYRGGRIPVREDWDRRARRLAAVVVERCPELEGYVGVDVILGEKSDGSDDRIVEVNPRLTTSYVGYRAIHGVQVAAAMLGKADGVSGGATCPAPVLYFADGAVERGAGD